MSSLGKKSGFTLPPNCSWSAAITVGEPISDGGALPTDPEERVFLEDSRRASANTRRPIVVL